MNPDSLSSEASRRRSPSSWPSQPRRRAQLNSHTAHDGRRRARGLRETGLGRLYTGGGVAVTADGAHVACGCEGALQLFASSTGRAALRVEAEADEFTAFALHPSNPSQLVTAARSRQLVAWALDLDGGHATAMRTWKAHRLPVGGLAYDPTGTLVASAGADAVAMVFDVNRGHCTHVFRGHEGVVHRVLFHPDANVLQLVSSAADNTVRVWSLGESSCLAVLRGHVGLPAALAFSPDGAPHRPRRARLPVAALRLQTGRLDRRARADPPSSSSTPTPTPPPRQRGARRRPRRPRRRCAS